MTQDPLLLIGRGGTGKTYLLNSIREAPGPEHRHYNASLIAFEDLVGFPYPDEARSKVECLQTPATVWTAESVLIDEISRCKPEHQNRLFSLVHERRLIADPSGEGRIAHDGGRLAVGTEGLNDLGRIAGPALQVVGRVHWEERLSEHTLEHPDKTRYYQVLNGLRGSRRERARQLFFWSGRTWLRGALCTRRALPQSVADIVCDVSRRIGYAANGPNDPDRLEIDDRVCQKIGDLSRWTSHINDQCIANGWAGYDAAVDWLPPEHWLARQFHDALVAACRDGELSGCGPDGRLLLRLRESHDEWRLEHLLVTLQHPRDSGSGADDGLRIPKPSTDARQAIPASGFARFYGQPAFGYIVCMNRGFAGKLDHATLKARHRAERDGYDPALALRTHRALSWLKRAESESRDPDARFIFLWIAFNAAYANEIRDRRTFSERGLLQRFLNRLVEADTDRLLYHMLWEQFPGPIRLLIDNQYVFQPYWEWRNGRIGEAQWQELFTRSKTMAHRALGRSNTRRVLGIVLERLYTLRNQLIHGGATWNGKVNRRQVKDGVTIMDRLVPTVIHLMLDHGTQGWGAACYPVLE